MLASFVFPGILFKSMIDGCVYGVCVCVCVCVHAWVGVYGVYMVCVCVCVFCIVGTRTMPQGLLHAFVQAARREQPRHKVHRAVHSNAVHPQRSATR